MVQNISAIQFELMYSNQQQQQDAGSSMDLDGSGDGISLNDRENQQEVNPNFGHQAQRQAENIRVRETALQERREQHQPQADRSAQARLLGNGAPFQDPNAPGYSSWLLMVNGHIQSGTFEDSDGICCHFDILATTNEWQAVAGISKGISQHAYKSQQTNRRVVWNFPFEVTYRSYGVSGWPQMVLTFYQRDFLGRDVICGYGITHVPTQPGSHTRYVHVFCPMASSTLASLLGTLRGHPAQYINPSDLLAKSEGRDVTRVTSAGLVKVQFNVTMKGLHDFGIYPFKA